MWKSLSIRHDRPDSRSVTRDMYIETSVEFRPENLLEIKNIKLGVWVRNHACVQLIRAFCNRHARPFNYSLAQHHVCRRHSIQRQLQRRSIWFAAVLAIVVPKNSKSLVLLWIGVTCHENIHFDDRGGLWTQSGHTSRPWGSVRDDALCRL